MPVVEPYARIEPPFEVKDGVNLLKRIERRARVSHRSEDRITEDSWRRMLQSVVLSHGDWSVTEHESVTVQVEIDRGISHEWVRHRLGAYTQESTRFVNYGKTGLLRFIKPTFKSHVAEAHWANSVFAAEQAYLTMLEQGESPQVARSVLPTCTATRLDVTYNLRSWRHFFIMRTCREAHPQMRQVTIPLLVEFQNKIPLLYEDIQPLMKQSEAMRLLR